MVRDCGGLNEARSFASELCHEALARGEEAEVADLSDCDTPPLV